MNVISLECNARFELSKKVEKEENMQRYLHKRSSTYGQLKMSSLSATDNLLQFSFTLWIHYAFRLPCFNNFMWPLTHVLNLISVFCPFSNMANTSSHTVTGLSRLSCTLDIILVDVFSRLVSPVSVSVQVFTTAICSLRQSNKALEVTTRTTAMDYASICLHNRIMPTEDGLHCKPVWTSHVDINSKFDSYI